LLNKQATINILNLLEVVVSKPTIIQVIKSVLSAAIGVQSEDNRLKDFEQGSLMPYVIAGVIFTIIFISALIFLVSMVIGA
jgi:hypothetical protein